MEKRSQGSIWLSSVLGRVFFLDSAPSCSPGSIHMAPVSTCVMTPMWWPHSPPQVPSLFLASSFGCPFASPLAPHLSGHQNVLLPLLKVGGGLFEHPAEGCGFSLCLLFSPSPSSAGPDWFPAESSPVFVMGPTVRPTLLSPPSSSFSRVPCAFCLCHYQNNRKLLAKSLDPGYLHPPLLFP